MLEWLFGKRKEEDRLPIYSVLQSVPSRGLPRELSDKEASGVFKIQRDWLEHCYCNANFD